MNKEGNWGAVGKRYQPEEGRVIERVVVLGHSFVRDLPLPAGNPLGDNSNKIIFCRKFFVPGAAVASIQHGNVWERFVNFRPNLTFLLIGGNDITPQSLPADIAHAFIVLGKKVKEVTGCEVKIITIERRPVPCRVSALQYNKQRTSVNQFLKHRDPFTVSTVG